MQSYKFKTLFVLALSLLVTSAQASFDLETCLNASNEISISHKVKPFGLLERSVSITKERCIIDISSVSYKFMKNSWQIDVCRSPIHVKKTDGGVEVVKKEGSCQTSPSSEFCGESKKLLQIIQDDGLIFASGEKSNLNDDHGKVNCVYLLLTQYMNDGKIFGEQASFVEKTKNRDNELTDPMPAALAPVPVYKDPENPDLETTPAEAHPEQKKEDSSESSSTNSNVSW